MEQMNDVLDGLVGLVIGGFEFAVGPVGRVGLVMEAAVSKRATETLVEEQEQEGNIDTFTGQPVGIATTIALQQSMPFQLAQIVAELVEPVGFRERWNVVMTASWICRVVQPPRVLPLWRRTSRSRMIRVSWSLMPG